MIRTRRIREVEPWILPWLTEYSRQDFERSRSHAAKLYARSRIWLLHTGQRPIMVLGATKRSFVNGIELWFLMCEPLKERLREVVRYFRRGVERLARCYGRVTVSVEDGKAVETRFVEFFGFKPSGGRPGFTWYEYR